MKKISTIGIVFETKDDALVTGLPIDRLYHWRENSEIASINSAIKESGFKTILIGNPAKLLKKIQYFKKNIDFIFNLSVGFITRYRLSQGPSLYSLADIPYSGADAYTKMVSQNKQLQKSFFDKLNIPTPSWSYIHSKEDISACKLPKHPAIVKPAYEGSSIGIYPRSLSRNNKETRFKAAGLIKSNKMPLIIENFIAGKEYKVGIIGNLPKVFIGMTEDTLTNGASLGKEFLHLSAKKDIIFSKKTADINRKEFRALRDDCLKIYRLLGPMDYATFDIRMDRFGQHYFLEVNADATLHPLRTLAKCCALHNMDFDSMIQFILNSSLKRQGLQ